MSIEGTGVGNVRANQIRLNSDLGITFNGLTSPHVNDPFDSDFPGPNNLQNAPVLTSATKSGDTLTVQGTLDTTAGTYTVDGYHSPSCDPSGGGEGATYIIDRPFTVAGTGAENISGSGPSTDRSGSFATATATGTDGTSQFSN